MNIERPIYELIEMMKKKGQEKKSDRDRNEGG